MWLSAFGGDAASASSRRAAGVVGLLLTSMHMTLLGALLALAPRPLFQHGSGHSTFTELEDQHLGGAIMLLVGGISYLAGGLWLTLSLMRGSAIRPTALIRSASEGEDSTARNADLADASGWCRKALKIGEQHDRPLVQNR
jgi:cytochrome c oxidase assembly factor CtaG